MKQTKLILLFFLLLFVVGCGIPTTYYYRIDYASAGQNNHAVSLPYTIGVAQFGADALYENDRLVYRESPYQAQFYNYRRWVAAPKKLVTENVIKQYQKAGIFQRVVRIPSAYKINYILRGDIQGFEEWDDGDQWFGVVTVGFRLQEVSSSEIVWENVVSESTLASKKAPVAVVQAISESLNRVVHTSILQINDYLKLNVKDQ